MVEEIIFQMSLAVFLLVSLIVGTLRGKNMIPLTVIYTFYLILVSTFY